MHANSPEYLSGDGTSTKLVGSCKLQRGVQRFCYNRAGRFMSWAEDPQVS